MSTEKFIEHGSGLGVDPTGDGPIGSVDGNHGGISDGHKVIDDGMVSIHTHGARVGELHVIASSPNAGKSVFNNEGVREADRNINSQPERFYAKANGAFLSEGWMG